MCCKSQIPQALCTEKGTERILMRRCLSLSVSTLCIDSSTHDPVLAVLKMASSSFCTAAASHMAVEIANGPTLGLHHVSVYALFSFFGVWLVFRVITTCLFITLSVFTICLLLQQYFQNHPAYGRLPCRVGQACAGLGRDDQGRYPDC